MELIFILVQPARPENVGFAARALKTMGFNNLRIVESTAHQDTGARKTAYGAHDVLEGIQHYDTLAEALSDIDLSIATTARQRIKRYDYYQPPQIVSIVKQKLGALQSVALVFGSEENGLSTLQLDQCDLVSTISLAVDYPSLNLAQSVLVYAYEFSDFDPNPESITSSDTDVHLQTTLKQQAEVLLDQLGFSQKTIVKRRIMDRILSSSAQDMALMMAVIRKIERTIAQSSNDA